MLRGILPTSRWEFLSFCSNILLFPRRIIFKSELLTFFSRSRDAKCLWQYGKSPELRDIFMRVADMVWADLIGSTISFLVQFQQWKEYIQWLLTTMFCFVSSTLKMCLLVSTSWRITVELDDGSATNYKLIVSLITPS